MDIHCRYNTLLYNTLQYYHYEHLLGGVLHNTTEGRHTSTHYKKILDYFPAMAQIYNTEF